MPSDLVINTRQIGNYPSRTAPALTDALLVQVGGLGGPYNSMTLTELASFFGNVGQISVGLPMPPDALNTGILASALVTPVGCTRGWNWYRNNTTGSTPDSFLGSGYALQECFSAAGTYTINAAPSGSASQPISAWQPIYTLGLNGQITQPNGASITLGRNATASNEATTLGQVNSLLSNTVTSFNSRQGVVTLVSSDVVLAGGALINSPAFTGSPQAPTPPQTDNSQAIATTAYVTGMINSSRLTSVLSFNGRYGNVELGLIDVTDAGGAPLASPAFTGQPTAPAPTQNNSQQIATTAWVTNLVNTMVAVVVSSFNGRQGAVTLTTADITGAGGAPINSPAFSGTPNAPTANPGTSTSQLATTAFVMAAVTSSTTGVVSWNGHTGVVVMTNTDIVNAGGALIASPTFTGTPAAPTAVGGTNTTQLATCAFVQQAVAAATVGVASFNGRTGAVALLEDDVASLGFALLASPTFTGVPAAPTAAPGTNSTQLATTAFVNAAVAGSVASFNGRTGAVTLTNNDISAAGGLSNPNATMTGVPTAPTAIPNTNTTQVATTAFVAAAVAAFTSIVVSSAPPASPQTGAGWFNLTTGQLYIWTGTTWTIAVNPPVPDLSGYVLKSGALMTGNLGFPLNTAANGSVLFNTQMVSGNPTTIAAGMGGLINVSSNGMLIGASGTLAAGATITTVNGLLIQPSGNVVISNPGSLSIGTPALPSNVASSLTIANTLTCTNYAGNIYFDGTNWRYAAAGTGWLFSSGNNQFSWLSAPSGAAGAVATLVSWMSLISNNLSVGNNISSGGIIHAGNSAQVGGIGIQYYPYAANYIALLWSGGVLWLYVDNSQIGSFNITASDMTLKQNVTAVTEDASHTLSQVSLYAYDMPDRIDTASPPKHFNMGFSAQQLQTLMPDAVSQGPTQPGGAAGLLSLDLMPILARCVGAIQQLLTRMQAIDGKAA